MIRRIRRKARTDAVTPERAMEIFRLDGGCVAIRLGGSSMDCWSRNRIEHVQELPRMGKRGTLLATLCEGHTEPGMRAGYVWCTDATNRQKLRDYIHERDAAEHPHVEPVHGCSECVQVDPYPASLL